MIHFLFFCFKFHWFLLFINSFSISLRFNLLFFFFSQFLDESLGYWFETLSNISISYYRFLFSALVDVIYSFSFGSQYLKIFLWMFLFALVLCRRVLLNLQIFGDFSRYFCVTIVVREYTLYYFNYFKSVKICIIAHHMICFWWIIHMHLRRMYILLLLGGMFCKCQIRSGWLVVVFSLYAYWFSIYLYYRLLKKRCWSLQV